MCYKISTNCYKLQTNPFILLFINSSVSKKDLLPARQTGVTYILQQNRAPMFIKHQVRGYSIFQSGLSLITIRQSC